MKRNHILKGILFKEGITLKKLNELTGIPLAYLSLCLNGKYVLNASQQSRIAEVLGRKVSELFVF